MSKPGVANFGTFPVFGSDGQSAKKHRAETDLYPKITGNHAVSCSRTIVFSLPSVVWWTWFLVSSQLLDAFLKVCLKRSPCAEPDRNCINCWKCV